MKKIIYALLLALSVPLLTTAEASANIEIYHDKAVIENAQIQIEPFSYGDADTVYLPCDDILKVSGATLGWDNEKQAIICFYNNIVYYIYTDGRVEVNGTVNTFDTAFRNDTFYINDNLLEFITDYVVSVKDDILKIGVLTAVGGAQKCYLNSKEIALNDEIYTWHQKTIIPIDDILPKMGYGTGWDNDLQAIVLIKDGITSYVFPNRNNIWVGATEYKFSENPLSISGKTYVTSEVFTKLTGYEVKFAGELTKYPKRDTLENTTRTDAHRLAGNSVTSGGGVSVIDGFGMELVSLSVQNGKNYAAVINAVSKTLDENITVYNMLVPTAAEYYAPMKYYPKQLDGMRAAYQNLDERVIPINVYDILAAHADEKLYFATDHHWTQRGAYYAYKAFMEYQDIAVPEIWTFENIPSYSHVGSLSRFASGTYAGTLLKNSPELLERFVPKHATVGTVYSDQNLKYSQGTVKAVNTNANNYNAFIAGDNPVSIFYTDADSDKTIVIIKESFGNAFATWAMNNYKKVCVVDPRKFNGFAGSGNSFNLKNFCKTVGATDVLFINYPVAAGSVAIRTAILKMA